MKKPDTPGPRIGPQLIGLILTIVIAPTSLLLGRGWAAAQATSLEWSQPINLSNSPESSAYPAIVADDFGYVHVFWSEEVGGESILDKPEQLIHNGNTIFYTRWDGVSWTQPIDILFVPGEDIADDIAVTVDPDNRLHAVWTGQSNFYYSSAPAWQANTAHAWSKPVVVATDSARSMWESDIVADASGNVQIAFATRGDEPSVYHIRSQDGGMTWELPIKLSEAFDRLETSISNVRAAVDGAGRLHVVWQTNQKEGFGQGIYYSRSLDGGITWTDPVRMGYRDPGEYGVSYPYLTPVGESELHLIYIDGDWHIGRWHRISRDGGATWSEPSHIISDLEGVNGFTIPLVDGAGRLHLITTMRTLSQVHGTFYARWLGTEWSPVEFAVRESQETGLGAHWTAATVRLGNEIHVLWNTNFSNRAGEIWYTRGRIPDVSPAPARAVPTAETPAPAPKASTPASTPVTPTPTATPEGQAIDPPRTSSPLMSPAVPLAVAILPSLLLVTGVIFWSRVRSR